MGEARAWAAYDTRSERFGAPLSGGSSSAGPGAVRLVREAVEKKIGIGRDVSTFWITTPEQRSYACRGIKDE
jgi:hypothetical protein